MISSNLKETHLKNMLNEQCLAALTDNGSGEKFFRNIEDLLKASIFPPSEAVDNYVEHSKQLIGEASFTSVNPTKVSDFLVKYITYSDKSKSQTATNAIE